MSPNRWKRVKELHARAQELPEDERQAFLEEQCGDDAELMAELQDLLMQSVEEDFLKAPAHTSATPQQLPEMQGRVLGDFVLEERIGQGGGGGAVYRARQTSLSRDVAVKILPALATLVPRHLERFKREAGAAARMNHEGVVPIYAFGEEDGVFYYAMELVTGGDLHRALQQHREGKESSVPSPHTAKGARELARLVAEVGDAVQFAHDRQVVHRDIKPQNLVLGSNGRLQLVDFGLARDENLGTITFTGEIRGTPYYMSPEQARISKQRVDHRTDVYSLGVVLYEMLTLHRPFEGRTSLEILDNISHTEARRVRTINATVPVDLETICHRAMEKDPERRYATARELSEDLRRFLAGEAIVARPPTSLERIGRYLQRKRQPVGLLVAAAVSSLLGVGGYVWIRRAIDRSSWPEIHVSAEPEGVVGPDGSFTPARVALQRLEPHQPVPGAPISLGSAPLEHERVEPGYYRIVVSIDGFGSAELTRDLVANQDPSVLTALIRPDEKATEGMVRIEAGRLTLATAMEHGCPYDGAQEDLPAFWIDAAEVSMGDYREFLADTGREEPKLWRDWPADPAPDDLPAVGVSWFDARDYAEWAGKRLVSHAEWEFAGSGAEGRDQPWLIDPSNPDAIHGNVHQDIQYNNPRTPEAFAQYLAMARSVRSNPEARTPEGLYHMFGNVSEYTESRWITRIDGELALHAYERASMGGAWDVLKSKGRFRHHGYTGLGENYARQRLGFRCAKSAPQTRLP